MPTMIASANKESTTGPAAFSHRGQFGDPCIIASDPPNRVFPRCPLMQKMDGGHTKNARLAFELPADRVDYKDYAASSSVREAQSRLEV